MQGLEEVQGLEYRRTLGWMHRGERLLGWLSARFVAERHEVHVQAASALAPVLGAVLQAVRQGLDLDADPARIDPVLLQVPGPARAGTRLPGAIDGFELAVRVILGQQVTVKAARTLTQRLLQRFGTPVETPWPALTQVFPSAGTLAHADPDAIGTLGIVRQRVRALQALATEVAAGRLRLHRAAPLQSTLDALRALPGVGEWTAQLIAMRALAWPDAWPSTDIGLMNALGTRDAARVAELAEPWRPWRAYAVMKLWHGLENPA